MAWWSCGEGGLIGTDLAVGAMLGTKAVWLAPRVVVEAEWCLWDASEWRRRLCVMRSGCLHTHGKGGGPTAAPL